MNYIFPGTESGVFSLHIRGIKIIAEGGGQGSGLSGMFRQLDRGSAVRTHYCYVLLGKDLVSFYQRTLKNIFKRDMVGHLTYFTM